MRLIAALLLACSLSHAADEESFRVYTDHPRLLLDAHRLRLLRRERERQSMRWNQWNRLMSGGAAPAEPGLAWCLFYQITSDPAAARKGIAFAQSPAAGLRQLAFVFDWCHDAMTPAESAAIAARIHTLLAQPADSTLSGRRDRVLAAIAVAETNPDETERILTESVTQWWRAYYAPRLGTPAESPSGGGLYPMLELLHAIRDNLNIDLRDSRPHWFANLPEFHIASHYPASYPGPANEYRIPFYPGDKEPDLDDAALSRAAGLAMVSFDHNALPEQFLQGWLIQDRFMLRGPFGAPYEFLWANPYQPGLAYVHLPLVFHDPGTGSLFVRASWEENSAWFGLFRGQAQIFEDGRIASVPGAPGAAPLILNLGPTAVYRMALPAHLPEVHPNVFLFGLRPQANYLVEPDDEEMSEAAADAAGTVELKFPATLHARVLVHEDAFQHDGR